MPRSTNPEREHAAPPRELQQLWFQLFRKKWSSLVVVPIEPGTLAPLVTDPLVEMASVYDLGRVKVINAKGASVQEATRLAHDHLMPPLGDARIVVAVDSPLQHPSAIPLIMSASAALLLVRIGSARFDAVRSVIDTIGRERILGTVAVHGRPVKKNLQSHEPLRVVTVDGVHNAP